MGVVIFALFLGSLAWTFIGFALTGQWTWEIIPGETSRADATRIVLTVIAGIGAVAALVVSYRRQQDLEEGRFLERLATATRQLGDREPIVQIAGITALTALADDPATVRAKRQNRRQQCVDVLCAYLRLPYSPTANQSAPDSVVVKRTWLHSQGQVEETRTHTSRPADREVRLTIIRVITQHLQKTATESWKGLSFDLTDAPFDGGDFSGANFTSGTVSFAGANFTSGTVNFAGANFTGGTVNFAGANFTGGTVDFSDAKFAGGIVNFAGAKFAGGTVNFLSARFTGGTVGFSRAKFTDGTVNYSGARFTGGTVNFSSAEFGGGTVDLSGANFTGGTVNYVRANFTGGTVDFSGANFTGGTVNFVRANFTGGTVNFIRATFTGGTVNFSDAKFTGAPVNFSRVRGQDPARLSFSDPPLWKVPPITPWSDGRAVPSWVYPKHWPSPRADTDSDASKSS